MIIDRIQRDLAAADRAFHEAADGEMRFVEHQPVAGVDRQLAEGNEGIGGDLGGVARQFANAIVRRDEPLLKPGEPCRVETERHVRLGDRRRFESFDAIPDAGDAGVVVRAAGGNPAHSFARRG